VEAQEVDQSKVPPLLGDRTFPRAVAQEMDFRKRQALAAGLATLGVRRAPRPLLVLTTSRSGSTWLSDLLSGINQSGPLPEHLRPQHFKFALAVADGQGLLRHWIEEAAALIRSRRSGGSKLIWDYFPELFPVGESASLRTTLTPFFELNPLCLRLRRRDKTAQAVSRYLSSQTGVYHSYKGHLSLWRRRGKGKKLMADSGPLLAYDAARIAHHEAVLQRAESHLDASIAAMDIELHELVYEDLMADPAGVLKPIVENLRPELTPGKQTLRLQRALRRTRLSKNENALLTEWRDRYNAEQS
jgi:LPS sulfotransferase NodH